MKYRDGFDHLGNPREEVSPLTWRDLAACIFIVCTVSAIVSGALSGAPI